MKKMLIPSLYGISVLLFGMSIPYAISSGAPITDVTTQQQIAELSKKIDNLEKSRYYLITYSRSGAMSYRRLSDFVITSVTPTGNVSECYGLIEHIEKQNKVISDKYKSVSIAQDFECVSSLDLKGVKPKEKIE
ncbi:Uncharacterised protein [Yersinia enterocolitica]|uniref:Phage protein n=1 Tax=Proteus terrae subsp. cibarius TaxID=626774 RepID=A0ABX6JT59_9GAMM|nr:MULTISPECIES: hypothetical protein [Enterobacterales]MBU5964333.1 hypothetical protein [Proteus mirabilis]QGW05272.1 hypothetical protein F9282_19945 [Proteus terrae subsp. cibarius]QHD96455.1 hypothetical protein GSM99_18830 [Proteus terrae subsp. cibarius]QIF92304.1 hypothetical protein GTH23_19875 [Proteus terrae subsp. cibarius]QJW53125.1 hypothetical protein HND96_19740 [Proteus terrae subsp. cibarius]